MLNCALFALKASIRFFSNEGVAMLNELCIIDDELVTLKYTLSVSSYKQKN